MRIRIRGCAWCVVRGAWCVMCCLPVRGAWYVVCCLPVLAAGMGSSVPRRPTSIEFDANGSIVVADKAGDVYLYNHRDEVSQASHASQ